MSSGDSLVCVLCQTSEENETTGALSSKEEVTAHQNCLLYSSGLFCRDSPQFDDLFGFSVRDVLREKQRGQKLTCSKCKKKGATVGCEIKSCKKSYHYPCALQAKAQSFENKNDGCFGILCHHCYTTKSLNKNTFPEVDPFDTFPSTSTENNLKRKLDFRDRREKTKVSSCRNRISSDSTDTDVTDVAEDMMPPLESDIEENSAPKELENGSLFGISLGTSHDTASHENGLPLLHRTETSDVSMNSSLFWRNCMSSGCAQEIFKDFIEEMNDIFTRIMSKEATQQDYDVALSVMKASGKLEEFVAKQQTELQKKLAQLHQAETAIKKVALSLSK